MPKARTKGQKLASAKARRNIDAFARAVGARRVIMHAHAGAEPTRLLGPTQERLAKAQGASQTGVDGVVRMRDGALEKLAASGRLWPGDESRNRILFEAAQELRRVHRMAGMDASPTSVNLLATGGGAGDKAYMIPLSEAAVGARAKLRQAYDATPRAMWNVVVSVAIEDNDLTAGGVAAGVDGAGCVRRGVARWAVQHGLEAIAKRWKFIKD